MIGHYDGLSITKRVLPVLMSLVCELKPLLSDLIILTSVPKQTNLKFEVTGFFRQSTDGERVIEEC